MAAGFTENFDFTLTFANCFYELKEPTNRSLVVLIPLSEALFQTHDSLPNLFYIGMIRPLLLNYSKCTNITASSREVFIDTARAMAMCGGGGGTGTVTSLTAGIGAILVPNPITTTGTISHDTISSSIIVTQGPNVATRIELPPGLGTVTQIVAGSGIVSTPNPITSTGLLQAPITSTTLNVTQGSNSPTTIELPGSVGSVQQINAGTGVIISPNPLTSIGTIDSTISSSTLTITQGVNTNTTIELPATVGTVKQLNAGNGVVLTPNPITGTGSVAAPITSANLTVIQTPNAASSINLPAVGGGPASTVWSNVTRDAQGRITSASDGTFTSPYGENIVPTATGFTSATNLSWYEAYIDTGAADVFEAVSFLDPSLNPSGTTNDPTTFDPTSPVSVGQMSILKTGDYLVDISFMQEGSQPSVWQLLDVTAAFTSVGCSFGNKDAAPYPVGPQNCHTTFILSIPTGTSMPRNYTLMNVSNFPVGGGNVQRPTRLATSAAEPLVSNPGAGHIRFTRIS